MKLPHAAVAALAALALAPAAFAQQKLQPPPQSHSSGSVLNSLDA